jgi:hypothetical protein
MLVFDHRLHPPPLFFVCESHALTQQITVQIQSSEPSFYWP